ncbi:hypothetical protein BVX97_03955 [bacterium E08(2017)]|nr:hypothetical protein BVX97_03955 [bacterium E08(2017)]
MKWIAGILIVLFVASCKTNRCTRQSEFKNFNIAQTNNTLTVLSKQQKVICTWESGCLETQSFIGSNPKLMSAKVKEQDLFYSKGRHIFPYNYSTNYFHIYATSIQTEDDLNNIEQALQEKSANSDTCIVVYEDSVSETTRINDFVQLVGKRGCTLLAFFHISNPPYDSGKILYASKNTKFSN